MTRVIDLVAVAAVAIVLLLPKPSLEAKVALTGDPVELDRVAALEDERFARPDSVDAAVALGQAYLDLLHADWALATTAQFEDAHAWRIHLVRATAYAERLQSKECVAEAARGVQVCEAAGDACPAPARIRFNVISSAMQALLDQGIDPHKDPQRAREAVGAVLHTTKASDKPPSR